MSKPNKPMVFVSLDLETSGTDHDLSVPIQVGLALGCYESDTKGSLIGGWDWEKWEWDERAAQVHNIDQDTLTGYPSVGMVDGMMAHWLWGRLPTHARDRRSFVVPLGWNVASFDMPFVRKHLPILANLFAYRSIDLNAICFFLGGEDGWYDIKTKAKSGGYDVLREINVLPQEATYADLAHDAEFDAQHAMASYFWLRGEYVIPF